VVTARRPHSRLPAFGGLEAVNLSKSEAGGPKCLPLLLLGLGIVLVVDLPGLALYNIEQLPPASGGENLVKMSRRDTYG